MNALPVYDDLQGEAPRALSNQISNSELYENTVRMTTDMNDGVHFLLGLIDAIRSYTPSKRAKDFRRWGPVDADKPGQEAWQWRLDVFKVGETRFTYSLQVHRKDIPSSEWIPLIDGDFDSSGGVRDGDGTLFMDRAVADAAGFPREIGADGNEDDLRDLKIVYNTGTASRPSLLRMEIRSRLQLSEKPATYEYRHSNDGWSQMRLVYEAEGIDGPAGLETVVTSSAWLTSGAGRGRTSITAGDGAGAHAIECWDRDLQVSYRRDWDDTTRGDSNLCVSISLLE